jgi:ATP/maltotriose-dependent transcriptional regulator MalT
MLFRELLRAQLAYSRRSEVPRLRPICAAWCAETGLSAAAVDHAVAAWAPRGHCA